MQNSQIFSDSVDRLMFQSVKLKVSWTAKNRIIFNLKRNRNPSKLNDKLKRIKTCINRGKSGITWPRIKNHSKTRKNPVAAFEKTWLHNVRVWDTHNICTQIQQKVHKKPVNIFRNHLDTDTPQSYIYACLYITFVAENFHYGMSICITAAADLFSSPPPIDRHLTTFKMNQKSGRRGKVKPIFPLGKLDFLWQQQPCGNRVYIRWDGRDPERANPRTQIVQWSNFGQVISRDLFSVETHRERQRGERAFVYVIFVYIYDECWYIAKAVGSGVGLRIRSVCFGLATLPDRHSHTPAIERVCVCVGSN